MIREMLAKVESLQSVPTYFLSTLATEVQVTKASRAEFLFVSIRLNCIFHQRLLWQQDPPLTAYTSFHEELL
jgi:hypothetical protein